VKYEAMRPPAASIIRRVSFSRSSGLATMPAIASRVQRPWVMKIMAHPP
jgi:hypothetical protein